MLFFSDETPIYAADVLDDQGRPVLPRQSPFQKTIQIQMLNGDAADQGAYVDLQADPPIAFNFVSVDETCGHLEGVFRCTAGEDGFATFAVRSDSDWSNANTPARVRAIGRQADFEEVTVLPAGLPSDASNFGLIVEEVEGSRVRARFDNLECTLSPSPDADFDKWARPRVREARVTATAPINAPTVIEHAPVIIQTLHPEVVVSLDPTCPEPRSSNLRVQLDATGNSPPFYLCFSDIGGDQVQIAFNSGGQNNVVPRSLSVDPEPRLLRLVTTLEAIEKIPFSTTTAFPVSVSAFDADLEKVALEVDVRSTDTSVLTIDKSTETLPGPGGDVLQIQVNAVAAGVAQIQVSPELFVDPVCSSLPITVTEP